MKLVDTFEARITKPIEEDQKVDIYQGQKFLLHRKGYEKGDKVTIRKFVDARNRVHFVIPTGLVRIDGLPNMDKDRWRESPRGAIGVSEDLFQPVTSRDRSIASLLFGWANGN